MQPPMLNAFFRPLFLGGAMLFALAGCDTAGQRATKAYAKAQQHVANGEIADAKRELLIAVAARDDRPDVWYALGQMRLASGELPEAFSSFGRADELRPGDVSILQPLAYTGYMVGATRLAKEAVDRLLVLSPTDPQGLAVKGLLALDKGEPEVTLEAANAILLVTPNDDTGLMLKARAMAVDGDLDGAIALLQEAEKTAGPKSGLSYSLLQFYRAKRDVAGMESVFPGLIAAQKTNFELALDYSNLLYRTGKIEQARKLWSDTVLANRNDARFIAWAFEVYDAHEPLDRPPVLDARLTKVGGSPLRSAGGQYLVLRRDYAGALALLGQGNGVADSDRGLYAVALDGLGRRAEAEALVNTILAEKNRAQDPNALMLRARWAVAQKIFDRASADAQTAIVADPSNLEARFTLAQSYLANSQPQRTRQVLAEAVRDLPRSRRALVAYLQFLHSIGDNAGAVSVARNFADANGSQPWSWGMLAMTCERAKDPVCATTARRNQQSAMTDFTFSNPARPFKMRGLFSPLPATG